jgi:hypothetical protein
MEKFSAARYYQIARFMEQIRLEYVARMTEEGPTVVLGEAAKEQLNRFLEHVTPDLRAIGLGMSLKSVDRIRTWLKTAITNEKVAAVILELDWRIRDEMADEMFMYVPPDRVKFYDQPELLGKGILLKFSDAQFDIVEAGNCYALRRSTACVFHLMRIMERGVQAFGRALGVSLVNEKNWQNILDEVNARIEELPKSDPKRVELAQAAASLYAVKLAWRNEVMHPKETYTLEEADNLIRQVGIFMQQLATIV